MTVITRTRLKDGLTFSPADVDTPESSGMGVLIGLLSAFGSAALVAAIFAVIYFFRYTSRGRILLDRIGRPGEYDDEQALAREEADALEEMDEISREDYFRAKGMFGVFSWVFFFFFCLFLLVFFTLFFFVDPDIRMMTGKSGTDWVWGML